jgi:glutamate formiminotransferase
MRLLEYVPNVSEGRDQDKAASITEEVKKHRGTRLLDVSSHRDHHRRVFTFIGDPLAVKGAALSLVVKTIELIDMTKHRGGHPGLGAVDVVPLVSIQGIEMGEAVQLAREFGKESGRKGISVFFYEEAAASRERKELPSIRKVEYEGLEEKRKNPKRKPDEGPDSFSPLGFKTTLQANKRPDSFGLPKGISS